MAYEKKICNYIRAIIRNILETLRYRITVTDSDISLQTEILHIATIVQMSFILSNFYQNRMIFTEVYSVSQKNPPLRGPDIFHFFTNG